MVCLCHGVVMACSHFVENWVKIGFPAKVKVKKEHASVPFDDQCSILEKVRTYTAVHVRSSSLLVRFVICSPERGRPCVSAAGGRERVPGEPQDLPLRPGRAGQGDPQAGRRPLRLRVREVPRMGNLATPAAQRAASSSQLLYLHKYIYPLPIYTYRYVNAMSTILPACFQQYAATYIYIYTR
jgi:hypothetical protein